MRTSRLRAEDWNRLLSTARGGEIEHAVEPFHTTAPLLRPAIRGLKSRLVTALSALGCSEADPVTLSVGRVRRAEEYLNGHLPSVAASAIERQLDNAAGAGIDVGLDQAVRSSRMAGTAGWPLRDRIGDLRECLAADLKFGPGWGTYGFLGTPKRFGMGWEGGFNARARENFLTVLAYHVGLIALDVPDAIDAARATGTLLALFLEGNFPVGWITQKYQQDRFLLLVR